MATTLTNKQKVFLLLLAAFLGFTLIGRLSYSKQLHGLLCAARTFHQYTMSDTRELAESNHQEVNFLRETGPPKQRLVNKVKKLKAEHILLKIKEKKATKAAIGRPLDETGQQVLPQALIIGVRKCGTRALLEMLETHPQIAASGPEVHFFDKFYDRGLDWYRHQMKASTADQITIEKTPAYYITEKAPQRIFKMNKNAKLLVIVRDPTTRVISDFVQISSKHSATPSTSRDFEKTVMYGGQVRMSYKAVQISMYAKYIDSWLEYFPLSQIFFVDGDKLISDPLPEMKRVEKFLGIRDVISSDMFYFNASRGFYCLSAKLNSKCLSSGKGREHPNVSPGVVAKLQAFFRPYNEKFFKKIKHRFDWP